MATAITRIDNTIGSAFGNKLEALFSVQLSGNYVTGGDTLDFSSTNLEGTSGVPVFIDGQNIFAGYGLQFIPGTASNNSKMKVFETGAALSGIFAELPAAAYPAALTANPFTIKVRFNKF